MAIINGTGGADTITPAFVSAGVTGGAPSDADDTIYGGTGGQLFESSDLLDGGGGDDLILISPPGFHGNSTLVLDSAGNDTVVGSANILEVFPTLSYVQAPSGVLVDFRNGLAIDGWGGIDVLVDIYSIEGSEHDDAIAAGAASVTLQGGAGDDWLRGGELDDSLIGGADNDTLIGGGAGDFLEGGAGNDRLLGGLGDDWLDGGSGSNTLIGGAGDDTYVVANASTVVSDSEGANNVQSAVDFQLPSGFVALSITTDEGRLGVGNALGNLLSGNAGADTLMGRGGADALDGGSGGDRLWGGIGNDSLAGGDGQDMLAGGEGSDSLSGDSDSDTLYGGNGADTIGGGEGEDWLLGEDGDDVILCDGGMDRAAGGAGNDRYIVSDAAARIFENAGEGADTVSASIGFYLPAEVEALQLTGSAPYGVGNALDNHIIGTAGQNLLLGGAGADAITGAGGWDTMFGQAGADVFVIGPEDGLDVIGDFTPGEDRLDLRGFGFESFAEVQALMMQGPTGTAILFDPVDRLMLNGVTARSALHESDVVLS